MKAIASVQPGDWVKSRNEATGQDEARQVMASVKRLAPAVVTVSLADSKTGKAETLTCTPEHTLFVQGQGWVEAGSVGIGTSIVSRAGPALEVTNLTWEKNKAEELAAGTGSSFGGYTVYNLTVEGDHTFFVGSAGGGTWVHNTDCYEIVDGIRRAKAASELGHETIPAQIIKDGSLGEPFDVPLENLRSPKDFIKMEDSADYNKWMDRLEEVRTGDGFHPITVAPGSYGGIPIGDVTIGE